METLGIILVGAGKFILLISLLIAAIGVIWWVGFKDWFIRREAKKDIFTYVESYRKRCTGNNRFLVNVETLQNSFREYDTKTINEVWLQLINERVIEQDPNDNEWCVRQRRG
jgi:N-glycosylase/DNA lyase